MKTVYDLEKKLLNTTEIQEYFKIESYSKLVELIKGLVIEGILLEVKASKSNGMNPPLYNKYRVKPKGEELSALVESINYGFPLEFSREFYLNNLKKYDSDKEDVDRLAEFYRNNREALGITLSINERSFQIWGREKFLKDGGGQGILKNLGLLLEDLNVYTTPEPFVYFSCNKERNQKVLIIENKDTWYSIRKLMLQGQRMFLGEALDTIIYGNGKGIEKSLEEYEFTVEDYLLKPAKVLYWGDIDYEGISIYERLKKRYSEKFNIDVFKKAYILMLNLAEDRKLQPYSEKQNKNTEGVFLEEMAEYKEHILTLLKAGFYIPQEIVNYSILRED